MSKQDQYDEVVARLRGLPRGAEVAWGDDARAPGGVFTGSIDVFAPAVADGLRMNWVWDVCGPSTDADGDDPLGIVLTHDRTVVAVWDHDSDDWLYREAVPLDAVDVETLLAAAHAAAARFGRRVSEAGGWTAEAVSSALTGWALEHAGRDDLVFRYDEAVSSLMVAHAVEQRELMRAGESYDVGGGIEVSPAVMDFLAGDPDRAAGLMRDVRDAFGTDGG